MTTLIIARHGNTFGPGETVTYVGARTDPPLTAKGEDQARAIGTYLKDNRLIPDVVYCSNLQRTAETARLAVKETGVTNPVYALEIFNEIDYGPDENRTREEIVARIGEQALKDWDGKNTVPPGWSAEPETITRNWRDFANQIRAHDDDETVLAVTSNGIARFAPRIAANAADFPDTKLATGALGILKYEDAAWTVKAWNLKPS